MASPATVLVADDDGVFRKQVCEALRKEGYDALEAQGGEEALRLGSGHAGPIHLLVTEVVMLRRDGVDLAARLSVLRPGMKVLYVSGQMVRFVREDALQAAGAMFLPKPVAPEFVLCRVREMLQAPSN